MDRLKHTHEREDSPEESPYDGPSKSQVKRDHHALQNLAKRLLSLPRSELERLELSAATWIAIDETARIKDVRVLGRHYKRIANLLARDDMAAVTDLLHGQEYHRQEEANRLHLLEGWRERLIAEGDEALGALLDAYPQVDRHQLRTLIRSARKDRQQGKPGGDRRLFRFLREALA
ncbi:MAG: ribosome biogenesis factor YjgA [Chromatiaceae bacterium]